jgi:hypothetical protein
VHEEMRSVKNEVFFFIIFNILIIIIIVWCIKVQLIEFDPEIEKKYTTASEDLSKIKASIIFYYCKNKRFPVTLKDLVPETILQVPADPWGNEYILTSLAWRRKDSGMDVLSMGGDSKSGGKGWKCDIISRIDLTEIRCEETELLENLHQVEEYK